MKSAVTLKLARTDEEIRNFQRFLFQVYCVDLKWHDKSKFPDGIFTDEYDSRSTFLLVCEGEEIVAGVRLVQNSESGFPHEHEIGVALQISGRERTREITRLISKRNKRRVFTIDIVKCLYGYGIHNQIETYLMMIDMNLFLLCRKLHVPLVPIGIPKYCEGSWAIPAMMTLRDLRADLEIKNPEVWTYISDISNLGGSWKE